MAEVAEAVGVTEAEEVTEGEAEEEVARAVVARTHPNLRRRTQQRRLHWHRSARRASEGPVVFGSRCCRSSLRPPATQIMGINTAD